MAQFFLFCFVKNGSIFYRPYSIYKYIKTHFFHTKKIRQRQIRKDREIQFCLFFSKIILVGISALKLINKLKLINQSILITLEIPLTY